MLAHAQTSLLAATRPIAGTVRSSRVVCCDETGGRVGGKTWWEWAFYTDAGVLHVVRPS